MKNSAPTMKDVAQTAGVSLGTVSKIINGKNVGDEYRVKVEAAIEALGYTVNQYARGLKLSKSFSVALIIPDILNPFFASLAHYIEEALYKKGYKLILCCSGGEVKKEAEYFSLVQMNKVDGIIALTYGDIEKYVSRDIALVAFDRQFSNKLCVRVSSDNFAGGVMAAEKLFELGCASPAFLRLYSTTPGEADRRRDGFISACEKHGKNPILVEMTDAHTHDDLLSKLLEENYNARTGLHFDGLFCNTDLLAFIAKTRFEALGITIPGDVQIIGFDGIHHFNAPDEPLYVSTIVQSPQNIAAKCVELVLTEDKSSLPSLVLLPVEFEYGGTTKPE